MIVLSLSCFYAGVHFEEVFSFVNNLQSQQRYRMLKISLRTGNICTCVTLQVWPSYVSLQLVCVLLFTPVGV